MIYPMATISFWSVVFLFSCISSIKKFKNWANDCSFVSIKIFNVYAHFKNDSLILKSNFLINHLTTGYMYLT